MPTALHIVTEKIEPLDLSTTLEARDMDASVTIGLQQITSAISWLNNECKIVHGNLTPTSIFITKGGDWKLGGFDLAAPAGACPADLSRFYDDLVVPTYRPPEFGSGKTLSSVSTTAPPYATDAWALGCLLYEVG